MIACSCPTCGSSLSGAGLMVDREAAIVVSEGRFAQFAPGEFGVFITLFDAIGKVRSKEQLLRAIAPAIDEEPEIKIVDVYVCKVRRKLSGMAIRIDTLWGQGYRLVPTANMEIAS